MLSYKQVVDLGVVVQTMMYRIEMHCSWNWWIIYEYIWYYYVEDSKMRVWTLAAWTSTLKARLRWQGFLPVSVWILFLRNLPQRRERLQQVAVLVLKLWKHVKVSNDLIWPDIFEESCYETSVAVRILSKWSIFNLSTWVPIGLLSGLNMLNSFAGAEPLEVDMGSRSLPFCDLARRSGISAWVSHTDWGCWPSGFAGAAKYEVQICSNRFNIINSIKNLIFQH